MIDRIIAEVHHLKVPGADNPGMERGTKMRIRMYWALDFKYPVDEYPRCSRLRLIILIITKYRNRVVRLPFTKNTSYFS